MYILFAAEIAAFVAFVDSRSILETPGHTPESISVVVYDLENSDREGYKTADR